MSSLNRQNPTRGWWRAYFLDHPTVPAQPTAHIYGSVSAGRTKTYCIQCWDALKRELRSSDQLQLENGIIEAVRSENTLDDICRYPIY